MKALPYGRHHIGKDDVRAVVDVLESDWITQGPKIAEFEKALAKYCNAKYAVAVSTGTAALHLACLAAGLKKGDEAITTPVTFLATANSVLYSGAKPVFADIDYQTINIDPEEIKRRITKKTKAILPVHFAGLPCDMPEIYRLAKERSLVVIEDACHALGAEYKANGKWYKVGSCKHSDMTVFSFHPVKHITTGEGGAIMTNSKKLYKKLLALRSHGVYKTPAMIKNRGPWHYEMREIGFNYRMTDFQCALGLSQINKLGNFLRKRQKIAKIYNKALTGIPGLEIPSVKDNQRHAYHLYVVKINYKKHNTTRKDFVNKMKKYGIVSQVHYIPVYCQPYYRKIGYKKTHCRNAENYYKKCVSLPIYHALSRNEANKCINSLKHCLSKSKT